MYVENKKGNKEIFKEITGIDVEQYGGKNMKAIQLIIDGKKIEAQVNEEDLKEIEKKREFTRQGKGEDYFFFDDHFSVIDDKEELTAYDENKYNSGNYFLTEKECADAARVVSLWLQMKRFADEYNKENLKFTGTDSCQEKYFIIYDSAIEALRIDWKYRWQDGFQIYFDSKETAQKAIDKFHDKLMWYFTEYGKE